MISNTMKEYTDILHEALLGDEMFIYELGAQFLNVKQIIEILLDYYEDEDNWDDEVNFCLDKSVISLSINKIMKNLENWNEDFGDKYIGTSYAQMGMFGQIMYG